MELKETELWQIVIDEAAKYGMGVSPNGEGHIRAMIREGISRAKTHSGDHTKAEAEANLREIVHQMIGLAKAKNYTDLQEDTFFGRKKCPPHLWPYCEHMS
jgi:hypothetical protein